MYEKIYFFVVFCEIERLIQEEFGFSDHYERIDC